MAVKTLGTNANNSIAKALAFIASMADADVANLANAIKDDQNVAHPVLPGCFSKNGVLFVPNRGFLKVLPGDYVGVTTRGWPILVSADDIANGLWTHS